MIRILCPIDFSMASVDAAAYAAEIASAFEDNAELQLTHWIFSGLRSNLFASYGDFIFLRAEEDLSLLSDQILEKHSGISVQVKVLRGDPLDMMHDYLHKEDFQMTVIGKQGLNARKTAKMGSVTRKLLLDPKFPVLVVPQAFSFNSLATVVLAVDTKKIEAGALQFLVDLVSRSGSKLKLVHVRQKGDRTLEIDPSLEHNLEGINFDYYSKYTVGSVNKSINDLCAEVKADLLCLIHRDHPRKFGFFQQSQIDLEIGRLSTPLLVIPD